MDDVRTNIVESGYDALGERFGEWSAQVERDPRDRYLQDLTAPFRRARVLDLGCVAGLPSTRELAQRFAVVGFELLQDEVVEIREPEGSVSFLWVLARRPR